ncbi:phosphotransferase family protein [Siminovitchia fortis]|uniref:Phosphotransferase n=1 Tax=Siminovitchia fortis TaxID=254758 RepID=A0A443IRB2_9BACI|nr:phosphotransferase family protein [Siminovitchia fortis]RWR09631.1 phosphotransferase [Siminovitchia fortis]WHY82253.1 phosphotransferase family protein [Siminovitchia fortis]
MKHLLEHDWEIIPAGGATGKAFFASKNNEKLFLKRNSSPFLAVLSAEGIVPKLIWTKRMENGDVITAQECLNGREFKPEEMTRDGVAKLLKKIHESTPLLSMLGRLGKTPCKPEMMLKEVMAVLDEELMSHQPVVQSLQILQTELANVSCETFTVCHGDVNHNNWLLSDNDEIFLIDWDGATIADPAMDIGPLLYWYIPRDEWNHWLGLYGLEYTEHLQLRMKWYVIAQTMLAIGWHKTRQRYQEMDFWMDYLQTIL